MGSKLEKQIEKLELASIAGAICFVLCARLVEDCDLWQPIIAFFIGYIGVYYSDRAPRGVG